MSEGVFPVAWVRPFIANNRSLVRGNCQMTVSRICIRNLQAEAGTAGGTTRVMRHMFRRIIAGDYFPVPEVRPRLLPLPLVGGLSRQAAVRCAVAVLQCAAAI